ncbi:MAG: methyltransferase domain-containing protein [Melioribacteraceae bacterium]|nr:methyltransferase domain-containing protein [Melioribacteraceae bacterium]MCF8297301.1 methyltransferase domain-containing protein [Saprospiraceae bacterium]MCF8428429.1 methyltransferase domain-containing protein [Bacteroidia bacterium]
MSTEQKYKYKIICPRCASEIEYFSDQLRCKSCSNHYPIVDGIPILIEETKSIFRKSDFTKKEDTTFNSSERKIFTLARKILPSITNNVKGKNNFKRFYKEIKDFNERPKILVVGGSILTPGMEPLLADQDVELIETDVAFGPRTKIIADGHSLPFVDNYFDGVIVNAVLEHVLDPYLVVSEIYRVMKISGIVYASTPFMQQSHMAPYDFTRFTYLGHRRLFRKFITIDDGPSCGPGTALAWSYTFFLASFTNNKTIRYLLIAFGHITSFFLKYFDYLLINKKGAYDNSSSYYFIGKKVTEAISDHELLTFYKGAW